MEHYEYTIGKIKYTQTELTWGQDKQILELLKRSAGKINPNEPLGVTVETALNILQKYDLLGEFWGIVLVPERNFRYYLHKIKFFGLWLARRRKGSLRQVDLSAATNSQLKNLFEDFFLLNKSLMKKLSLLKDGLDLISKAATEKNSNGNSKTQNLSKTGSETSETISTGKPLSSTPPAEDSGT